MSIWQRFQIWLAKRRLARARQLIDAVGFTMLVDTPFYFQEKWPLYKSAESLCLGVKKLHQEISELEDTVK